MLAWTATPSTWATGTRVFRAATSGGPYSQIAQIAGLSTTTYTDSPGGGTFYYVVEAYYSGNGANWTSLNSNQASITLSGYTTAPQGNWVNTYGSAGYDLAAWNTASSDLISLPAATVTFDQGSRYCWACSTGNIRALQSPDQSDRRAATYYDPNQLRVHLTFSSAYSGMLSLYAVDWDTTTRRETITVDDGSGPRNVNITTDFSQGAWMTFSVNVTSGGTITITATRTAGVNTVLSGIFLN
jgi:hypothetical protein